jgi:CRISPR/Cas system-associated endonuclease Cas1
MLREARVTKKMYRELFGDDFRRNFERDSDDVNKRINIANNALYNYCGAIVHMLGLCPHFGVLHGKTRNSLILDLSEIIKVREYYSLLTTNREYGIMLKDVADMCFNKQETLIRFIEDVFGTTE